MLLYRVEGEDRVGPYYVPTRVRSPFRGVRYRKRPQLKRRFACDLCRKHRQSPMHPSALEEFAYIDRREVCAFTSPDAAALWFAGFEDALKAHGFSLIVYDAEEQTVRFGASQVLFQPHRAVRLGVYSR